MIVFFQCCFVSLNVSFRKPICFCKEIILDLDGKEIGITSTERQIELYSRDEISREVAINGIVSDSLEKMVLENTIDGMVKDVIKEKENLKKVNETTTDSIKKVVNKRLKDKLNEDKKAPGYATYEKAIKQSGSETEKYHKDLG